MVKMTQGKNQYTTFPGKNQYIYLIKKKYK